LLVLIIMMRIKSVRDSRTVVVKETDLTEANPLASAFGGQSKDAKDKMTETTVMQYDNVKMQAILKSAIMGTLIPLAIHYYWALVPPLIIQSALNSATIVESELFQIYILGQSDVTHPSLRRPFKTQSMFPDFQKMKREAMASVNDGATTRKNKSKENRMKVRRGR